MLGLSTLETIKNGCTCAKPCGSGIVMVAAFRISDNEMEAFLNCSFSRYSYD